MKEEYEIIINENGEHKIKIEATDVKDAVEKFKEFIKLCYDKEIFLEEIVEEDIEVLDEDLDNLYDSKMKEILFEINKPKKAIIVDFE